MRILQDMLDESIKAQFTLQKMGAKVIERRLEQLGVTLTEAQKSNLRDELAKGGIDHFSLSLGDSQVTPELLAKQPDGEARVTIDLGDTEPVIKELADQFLAQFTEAIPDMAFEMGEIIARGLLRRTKGMLRRRRSDAKQYQSLIAKRWRLGIDLLETMIAIAAEAGEHFNEELRREDMTGKENLVEATTRLHARACQVASEVLTLLKAGYADGAHARWRCRHEIAVVLFFLASSGDEGAERYLLHERVESYKAAVLYQEHCERLGYEPLTEQEMAEFKAARDELVARFGKSFAGDYGWAAGAVGTDRPTFRDIESKVEMDHMRPFYKMASHNVHANPKGVFFKLGVFSDGPDLLLAGPSILGLADAGQGTAISISQATTALLTTVANMDRLVICDVMRRFSAKTGEAFLAAQQAVEEEVAHNNRLEATT